LYNHQQACLNYLGTNFKHFGHFRLPPIFKAFFFRDFLSFFILLFLSEGVFGVPLRTSLITFLNISISSSKFGTSLSSLTKIFSKIMWYFGGMWENHYLGRKE